MSRLELIWTLQSFIGMGIAMLVLREVWADWSARRRLGKNGPLKLLIWSHARAAAAYLGLHFVFALAGISAMLEPNSAEPLTSGQTLRIALVMAGQVVMILFGLSDLRDRYRLRTGKG